MRDSDLEGRRKGGQPNASYFGHRRYPPIVVVFSALRMFACSVTTLIPDARAGCQPVRGQSSAGVRI